MKKTVFTVLLLVAGSFLVIGCAKDGNDDPVGGGKIQKTVDRLVYVVDNQDTPYVVPTITGSSVTAHPFDGLDDEGIEFFRFKRIDPDTYVSEYD